MTQLKEFLHPKKILDHGELRLLDFMGKDLHVVNAARQSFGWRSEELTKADKGLIGFLMRERHGTPFEMVQFMFQVKCPIFVAREWMRHRWGSFNEYSGRYTKMMKEFYVPTTAQCRTQTGKPGSYKFESLPLNKATSVQTMIIQSDEDQWGRYETLLEMGVAKEVARMVLPVNQYTQFTWSVNLRALFNFISLRSDESAMWEIRQYSQAIEPMIKEIVPYAWEAFEKNGRIAP